MYDNFITADVAKKITNIENNYINNYNSNNCDIYLKKADMSILKHSLIEEHEVMLPYPNVRIGEPSVKMVEELFSKKGFKVQAIYLKELKLIRISW